MPFVDGDVDILISIHAPRVGSDGIVNLPPKPLNDFNPRSPCGERHALNESLEDGKKFQSTLPVWGATIAAKGRHIEGEISIHAPRVGSDFISLSPAALYSRFQSTLPVWGATGEISFPPDYNPGFQSTLPVWGATPADEKVFL